MTDAPLPGDFSAAYVFARFMPALSSPSSGMRRRRRRGGIKSAFSSFAKNHWTEIRGGISLICLRRPRDCRPGASGLWISPDRPFAGGVRSERFFHGGEEGF
jgi:hypothetical protein